MNYIQEAQTHKLKLITAMQNKVNEDADGLKLMIDDLAERATDMQGQGLILFIQTRNQFLTKVETLRREYTLLLCEKSEHSSYPRATDQ